jgi:hypothetical protein
MKNRSKPNRRDTTRPAFLRPVFLGGIGMYQMKAHMKRKMNKFNFSAAHISFKQDHLKRF